MALLKTQDAGYLRKQLASERKRYRALVENVAPRVPGIRLAWLQQKPLCLEALQHAGLLDDVGIATTRSRKGRETVKDFGKKTIWVDDENESACSAPGSVLTHSEAIHASSAAQDIRAA